MEWLQCIERENKVQDDTCLAEKGNIKIKSMLLVNECF